MTAAQLRKVLPLVVLAQSFLFLAVGVGVCWGAGAGLIAGGIEGVFVGLLLDDGTGRRGAPR